MEKELRKISIYSGISYFDLKVQLRLLLPLIEVMHLEKANSFNDLLINKIETFAYNYKKAINKYHILCGSVELNLDRQTYLKKENKTHFYIDNEYCKKHFQIKPVNRYTSEYIENHLHYLKSFRYDADTHIGLFLENYKCPIGYLGLSKVDREDKIYSLGKFIGTTITNDIYEVTRVYGCKNIPKNSISALMSYCSKLLKEKDIDYLITAVNPYLGFTGSSLLASNFIPFSLRNTQYNYNDNYDYITKRASKSNKILFSNNSMPPNILYVKK